MPEKKTDTATTAAGTDATLSYEDAREQLIEVVRTLEQGGTTLAESLALWERGEDLAKTCQDALDGARRRLDAVLEADD
jgi:exodeoxyribonuclease VII small subunit